MRLPIPSRKSQTRRLLDRLSDSLDVSSAIKPSLPAVDPDNVRRAGLFAVVLTGVTAGSAGISALRRRNGGARGDS